MQNIAGKKRARQEGVDSGCLFVDGDIRCRSEVSGHLAYDARQGVHARKVMESYQIWLGEGPELGVLLMLGLFDRPTDEKALEALLKSPALPSLTKCAASVFDPNGASHSIVETKVNRVIGRRAAEKQPMR